MKKLNLLFANLSLLLILGACKPNDKSIPNGFVLHPDFNMELVASEPIIFDPIEMKFNEMVMSLLWRCQDIQ